MVGQLDLAFGGQKSTAGHEATADHKATADHRAFTGHQATIDFLSDSVVLRFPNFRAAAAMASVPESKLLTLGGILSWSELRLMAQIGQRHPFEVYPRPGWIVRLISPSVRRMLKKR